jgi:hypothetical protein
MKRALVVAFTMLMLGSLLLVGTTKASESGYTLAEYYGSTNAVTVDGMWVGAEWTDAYLLPIYGQNARWAYKMDSASGSYLMSFLVESSDNTTDTGDRWQICIDGAADGGTAPNDNDNKIEIEGHTTLKVYVGNGTGWVPLTTTAVTWKDSLTTSPMNSANHYLLEVKVDKGALGAWGANAPPHGVRVAMYDASNQSQGWVAWPPTSADNPSRWGIIATYTGDPLPESLSIGVVVLLSSVAMLVGAFCFRKRSKIDNCSQVKL